MQPVILDTDVASLTHKRKLTGPLATRLIGREPLITFVTFGELTKWTEIRHWGTRSRQELAAWPAMSKPAGQAAVIRPSPRSDVVRDAARPLGSLIPAWRVVNGRTDLPSRPG